MIIQHYNNREFKNLFLFTDSIFIDPQALPCVWKVRGYQYSGFYLYNKLLRKLSDSIT